MFPLRLIFTAFCNTLFCVIDNGIDGEALVALTERAVEILLKNRSENEISQRIGGAETFCVTETQGKRKVREDSADDDERSDNYNYFGINVTNFFQQSKAKCNPPASIRALY